jgi:basic amino acid/polyamine antiporter, APA family
MMGAGVFVGLGIAIDVAGAGIGVAVTLAACLALVNQTVLMQPAVLETSENPFLRADWQHFAADWTLFLARLTAVATVALGPAGYLLKGLRLTDPIWLMPLTLTIVVALTVISFRLQTNRTAPQSAIQTAAILAMVALLGLVFAGLPRMIQPNSGLRLLFVEGSFRGFASFANLLQATALLSVAFAGEQPAAMPTVNPRQALKAFRFALVLTWLLYLGVAIVSLMTLQSLLNSGAGLNEFALSMAPLSNVMQNLPLPGGIYLITLGAVAGMTGVALRLLPQLANGLLELSRSPTLLSTLLTTGQPPATRLSPRLAKLLVTIALGCIVLVGDVRTIWSFSAFAFLLSTALMHGIALRRNVTFYPRWQHWLGLVSCLFLAFWVSWDVWLVSLGLVALALIWRGVQYWSEDP